MAKTAFDFNVTNEGSLYLLRPKTDEAKFWVEENLPADRLTFAGAVAVEHRYIRDIVGGIINDGLTVSL